jgi:hypothetical protein
MELDTMNRNGMAVSRCEEFQVRLDYDVLPELVSFDLILDHLKSDYLKNNNGIS